jgi:thiosulfate dehydrogenase [quinone] large subunit
MTEIKPDPRALTMAFWILRLWLGLRALSAGLEKFSEHIAAQQPLVDANGSPDPSGALVEVSKKVYGLSHYHALPSSLQDKLASEPLLPSFLTTPFYAVLGYLLVALGLMLLLGLRTRDTLFAMGLLYTALTFGLILLAQDQGVAFLGVHIVLIVLALNLVQYNRLTVTRS